MRNYVGSEPVSSPSSLMSARTCAKLRGPHVGVTPDRDPLGRCWPTLSGRESCTFRLPVRPVETRMECLRLEGSALCAERQP